MALGQYEQVDLRVHGWLPQWLLSEQYSGRLLDNEEGVGNALGGAAWLKTSKTQNRVLGYLLQCRQAWLLGRTYSGFFSMFYKWVNGVIAR